MYLVQYTVPSAKYELQGDVLTILDAPGGVRRRQIDWETEGTFAGFCREGESELGLVVTVVEIVKRSRILFSGDEDTHYEIGVRSGIEEGRNSTYKSIGDVHCSR